MIKRKEPHGIIRLGWSYYPNWCTEDGLKAFEICLFKYSFTYEWHSEQ